MKISLVLVLLFAVTQFALFVLFTTKPAIAQEFDLFDSISQTNDCLLGGFSICNNLASLSGFLFSPEGSAVRKIILVNECTGSDDPTDPTSCANTAGTELFLTASDQAFLESNSRH